MKHGLGVLALMLAGAADAAEPAAPPALPESAPARAAPAPTRNSAETTTPAERKPLDLRVGNIRNYMMPKEYLAAIGQPDADKNTVVVEGQRVLVPMERIEDVPPGLFALWYGAKHPTNAWRLLAPMVNAPSVPPDVVPKREFRWGP